MSKIGISSAIAACLFIGLGTPPTVERGLVYFGSRDGSVYCLRAEDGQLVWRFRAGPRDVRVLVDDQPESAWPVHGSPLVQNGRVYFVAGRSSYLDGGLRFQGLDARTGTHPLSSDWEKTPHRDDFPAGQGNRNQHQPPDYAWRSLLPFQSRAMLLAGDRLLVAGWTDAIDAHHVEKGDRHLAMARTSLDSSSKARSQSPFSTGYQADPEGKSGGLLWVVASDGRKLSERKLESPPVFDAMASVPESCSCRCRTAVWSLFRASDRGGE